MLAGLAALAGAVKELFRVRGSDQAGHPGGHSGKVAKATGPG